MLGGERGHGHDARGRRQGQQERHAEPRPRPPAQDAIPHGRQQGDDVEQRRHDPPPRRADLDRGVEAEPDRPEGEPQVVQDHPRLRQGVRQRRVDRSPQLLEHAALREHVRGDDRPAREEARVEPAAAPDRRGRLPQDQPVVAEDQQRQHDRGLLRAHRGGGRQPACDQPPRPPARRRRLGERRQRRQAEHARHRLQPLVDVGHRLRAQRVHRPQRRDARGQFGGMRPEAVAQPRREQREPREREQRQRRQRVDAEIRDVVAERLRPPDRAIDGERQVGQRPGGHVAAPQHRPPGRHERADRRVVGDLAAVVHDEPPAQGVEVGDARADDDEQGRGAGGESQARHGGDPQMPSIAASAATPTSTSAQPMKRAIGGRSA